MFLSSLVYLCENVCVWYAHDQCRHVLMRTHAAARRYLVAYSITVRISHWTWSWQQRTPVTILSVPHSSERQAHTALLAVWYGLFFFLWNRALHNSLVGLNRNLSAFASQVLGLKLCTTMLASSHGFWYERLEFKLRSSHTHAASALTHCAISPALMDILVYTQK